MGFSLILARSDKAAAGRHLLGRREGRFSNVELEEETTPQPSFVSSGTSQHLRPADL